MFENINWDMLFTCAWIAVNDILNVVKAQRCVTIGKEIQFGIFEWHGKFTSVDGKCLEKHILS